MQSERKWSRPKSPQLRPLSRQHFQPRERCVGRALPGSRQILRMLPSVITGPGGCWGLAIRLASRDNWQ
jgi:hypothetical protein